jgi:hypothetical protein
MLDVSVSPKEKTSQRCLRLRRWKKKEEIVRLCETIFFQLFVGEFMSYLRYLRIVVSNTYCVVVFFFLHLMYHILQISLDCPFLLPLRYSLTFVLNTLCYFNFKVLLYFIIYKFQFFFRGCHWWPMYYRNINCKLHWNWNNTKYSEQTLENTEGATKMDNPEKFARYDT